MARCCLCKSVILGYGHNAMPLKNGFCCDDCNFTKVIPARLKPLEPKPNSALREGINREISIDNTKPVKQIFEELASRQMKRDSVKFQGKK